GGGLPEPIRGGLADDVADFGQSTDTFLDEEGIALGALDELLLQIVEARVGSEQCAEKLLHAVRRQRVESDLTVDASAAPSAPIFGPIVHEEQHARDGDAFGQEIQDRLRLGVDPVK